MIIIIKRMQTSYVVKLVLKPVTLAGEILTDWNCHAQVEQVVSSAQFGDLIEFSYPIGYSHWGVYDGDGYVIHFAVAGKRNDSIKIDIILYYTILYYTILYYTIL